MKKQILLNGITNDIAPTLLAGYYKYGVATLITGNFGTSGGAILEIETMQKLINADSNGNAKAIRACYGQCGFDSVLRGGGQGITGVMEETEPKIVGYSRDSEIGKVKSRHLKDLANTITTCTGSGNNCDQYVAEPKMMQLVGDRGNPSVSVKETAFTVCSTPMSDRGQMVMEPKIAASRGRGKGWQQQLEINDSGTSYTITSVNKDNLLIEPKINLVGQYDSSQNSRVIDTEGISYCMANGHKDGMPKIIEPNVLRQERTEQCKKLRKKNGDKGMKFNQGNKEYNPRTDGVSNTLSTSVKDNMLAVPELRMEDGCMVDKEGRRYRIRKLTPTECFRLQDVSDEDIGKIRSYRDSETAIICDANGEPIMNMDFDKPSKNARKITIMVNGEQREYYSSQLIWQNKGKGISKTAQYKLAGNSICVAPMYHIFRKLFIEKECENQQLELF